jgi:hypothetical protein
MKIHEGLRDDRHHFREATMAVAETPKPRKRTLARLPG